MRASDCEHRLVVSRMQRLVAAVIYACRPVDPVAGGPDAL
jgi:hypothetical protein